MYCSHNGTEKNKERSFKKVSREFTVREGNYCSLQFRITIFIVYWCTIKYVKSCLVLSIHVVSKGKHKKWRDNPKIHHFTIWLNEDVFYVKCVMNDPPVAEVTPAEMKNYRFITHISYREIPSQSRFAVIR